MTPTNNRYRSLVIYALTLLVSVLLLWLGHQHAGQLREHFYESHPQPVHTYTANERARIQEILFVDVHNTLPVVLADGSLFYNTITTISFLAALDSGGVVSGVQGFSDLMGNFPERQIAVGDHVILQYDSLEGHHQVVGFVRINHILIFGAVLVVAIVVFGRWQGLHSLMSLGFTVAAIFMVFVPVVLYGGNPYVWALAVSLYAAVSTLLMVVGANKKALTTMAGTLLAVGVTAALTVIMSRLMGMTGLLSPEDMNMLLYNPNLNLNAIVFAGIILGSLGATMDVCMSISSALWEVSQGGPTTFSQRYRSGIAIGKDILGTMANTLVLAYIGSYLTVIMLMRTVYGNNLLNVFYLEPIIAELLRALVGVAGIFLAIPITTVTCAWLYGEKNQLQ